MEKVIGIGGVFFRARDPSALSAWYWEHLGVNVVPTDYGATPWQQEAGPTVISPFAQDSDYFRDPQKNWAINFRVRNLERFVSQLRSAGISVEVDATPYPNGNFARLADPEGNPIELWQPANPSAPGD